MVLLIAFLGFWMLVWAFWIRFEVKSLKKEFIEWDGGKDFFTWKDMESTMKRKDGEDDT